jgi:hypothetical protein
MAAYRVATVNEEKRPIAGVVVEAVSLNSWPDVSATATTGRNGTVQFTGLTGPHFFRPRVRRTSATVGGRVYTGVVEVQVVHSGGEGVNVDYVVDSNGMGTHLTLFGASGAMAAALTAGGRKTIWICTTHTEPVPAAAHALGAQVSSKVITIWGAPDQRSALPTSSSVGAMFTYDKDTDCSLRFHNIRFTASILATYDIFLQVAGGAGIPLLAMTFESCDFDTRAIDSTTLAAGLANGDKNLKHCTGSLTNIIRSTSSSGSGGTIAIDDCYLSWDGRIDQLGDYEGAWTASIRVTGGHHTVTSTEFFVWGNAIEAYFRDLAITFTAAGGTLFTQGPNVGDRYIGEYAIFQNVFVTTNRVDNRLIYFYAFAAPRTDPIVIDGFHGRATTSVGTPVPMIEIADVANTPPVHLGLISCDGAWSDCYVGPAWEIPGDLDIAGDLCVSGDAGVVGYLRVGSCSAPGNTTDGDLTAIRLFINNDSNYAFTIVSSNPRITVDANDYVEYNRASNYFTWVIGSTEYLRLNSTALLTDTINELTGSAGVNLELVHFENGRIEIPPDIDWGRAIIYFFGPSNQAEWTGTDKLLLSLQAHGRRDTIHSPRREHLHFYTRGSSLADSTANLTVNCTDVATTLTVSDSSVFAADDIISIEDEWLKVTGTPTGTTITVDRGVEGTVNVAHTQPLDIYDVTISSDKFLQINAGPDWDNRLQFHTDVDIVSAGRLYFGGDNEDTAGQFYITYDSGSDEPRFHLGGEEIFHLEDSGNVRGIHVTDSGRILMVGAQGTSAFNLFVTGEANARITFTTIAGGGRISMGPGGGDALDTTLDRAAAGTWQTASMRFTGSVFLQSDEAVAIASAENTLRGFHWNDIAFIIDSDNNSTTDLFRVMHNATTVAGATDLFTVDEAGKAKVFGELEVAGDLLAHKPLIAKSGDYTITTSDEVVIADAAAASFTLTLPTAVGNTGKVYWVKKIDATANTVTIDGDGAETIDGAATAVLTTQYEAITVISDGTEWWVL